jgi:hypothetical protein
MSATTQSTGLVIRNIPLFAYRTRRTLQYYAASSVITGTATANAYVFSANGIFDPDISGTGGQPMGFDQMMQFYNHYTVIRSRIRVLFTNTSATLTPSVAVVVSGSSTVLTSIEQLVENGDLSLAQLGFAGQQGSMARLTRSAVAARFQGIDDVMDDPNMRGDVVSNPTEQFYFHLATWNPYTSAQVTSNFQVVIEYETMFHEPRKGPLS